jgi:hypothetical protein
MLDKKSLAEIRKNEKDIELHNFCFSIDIKSESLENEQIE